MITAVKFFRPLDAILIAVLTCCAVGFFPFVKSHGTAMVIIYRDNRILATYPLSEDRLVAIQGDMGAMSIRIQHGSAKIESSACPRGVCIHARPVSQAPSQIICAPNRVLIEIQSTSDNDKNRIDATTN